MFECPIFPGLILFSFLHTSSQIYICVFGFAFCILFCILFTLVYAQLLSLYTMCINPHYHANMMLGQCPVSLSISFSIASFLVFPFHPCQSKQMATLQSWDCCHFILNVEGWVSFEWIWIWMCNALCDVLGWLMFYVTSRRLKLPWVLRIWHKRFRT